VCLNREGRKLLKGREAIDSVPKRKRILLRHPSRGKKRGRRKGKEEKRLSFLIENYGKWKRGEGGKCACQGAGGKKKEELKEVVTEVKRKRGGRGTDPLHFVDEGKGKKEGGEEDTRIILNMLSQREKGKRKALH